jgi:hypothetical protein
MPHLANGADWGLNHHRHHHHMLDSRVVAGHGICLLGNGIAGVCSKVVRGPHHVGWVHVGALLQREQPAIEASASQARSWQCTLRT